MAAEIKNLDFPHLKTFKTKKVIGNIASWG